MNQTEKEHPEEPNPANPGEPRAENPSTPGAEKPEESHGEPPQGQSLTKKPKNLREAWKELTGPAAAILVCLVSLGFLLSPQNNREEEAQNSQERIEELKTQALKPIQILEPPKTTGLPYKKPEAKQAHERLLDVITPPGAGNTKRWMLIAKPSGGTILVETKTGKLITMLEDKTIAPGMNIKTLTQESQDPELRARATQMGAQPKTLKRLEILDATP
jgi:hypothetical protein